MTQPYFGLIDNPAGSPWFTATGGFSPDSGQQVAPAGTGSESASFTFTGLPASSYKVWASWATQDYGQNGEPYGAPASDAPFTAYDGTTPLGTVTVDQTYGPGDPGTPAADLSLNGWPWKLLGTYSVSSGTLKVALTDAANGAVLAGRVRVADASLDPSSPTQPAFTDPVSDAHLYPSWNGSVNQSHWSYDASGSGVVTTSTYTVYNQTAEWLRSSCEVVSKVRVDAWATHQDGARAGVALCLDSNNGYGLIFWGGNDGGTQDGVSYATFDCVHLIDDFVQHGPSAKFTWSTGTWYWFRLRRDASGLHGRVWADGSTEPSSWTVEWSTPSSDRTAGYPGVYACDHSTVSAKEFSVAETQSQTAGGSGSGSASHPTVSAAGTFANPSYHGTGSPPGRHPTVSSAGTHVPPHYAGSGQGSATHPSAAAAGTAAPPSYHGSGTPTAAHPAATLGLGRSFGPASCPLSLTGSANPSWVDRMTLAVTGGTPTPSSQADLYVQNNGLASPTTLAVRGGLDNNYLASSGADLFTVSRSTASSSPTLFVKGPLPSSGQGTLVVNGPIPVPEAMNLFLAKDNPPGATLGASLCLEGGQNQVRRSAPLSATGWNAPLHSPLNLSLVGVDYGGTSGPMNLVLAAGPPTAPAGSPLYVRSEPPWGDWTPLSVRGLGVNPGHVPASEPMNLSLTRGPEAGLTLLVYNNRTGSPATLVVSGAAYADGGAAAARTGPSRFGVSRYGETSFAYAASASPGRSPTLYVAGDGGLPSSAADLTVAGAATPSSSGSATLAVPSAVGGPAGPVQLYVNGWGG